MTATVHHIAPREPRYTLTITGVEGATTTVASDLAPHAFALAMVGVHGAYGREGARLTVTLHHRPIAVKVYTDGCWRWRAGVST